MKTFKNNHTPQLLCLIFFGFLINVFTACENNPLKVDISAIEAEVKIDRFDKEIFEKINTQDTSEYGRLRKKYGTFFEIYVERLLELGPVHDPITRMQFFGFVNDKLIRELYSECKKQYPDLEWLKEDLEESMRYFKYHFPDKEIPAFATLITVFNYAHPATDSAIGIGLDFYLGSKFEPYKASNINFPEYAIRRFRKEYIVPNTVKAVAYHLFEEDPNARRFIQKMIQEGKWLYFTDALLPDVPDSLKIGYTDIQLDWCKENEAQMWAHYIDKKLLYSADQMEYAPYFADAPYTAASDVPPESAPKIAVWTGWQIVRNYMKNNPEVKLDSLMKEKDFEKILKQSKYKPD